MKGLKSTVWDDCCDIGPDDGEELPSRQVKRLKSIVWDDCCDIGPDGGEELPEAAPSASASTLAASRPVQTLPIGPRSRKKASKAPSCNSRSTGCSSAPPPPSACAVPVPAIVTHITFSTRGADEELGSFNFPQFPTENLAGLLPF